MEPLDILVILDRSGSMQDAKSDHEGGLRSFVEDQKRGAGEARFTLIQFDTANPCEIVYDRAKLDDVKDIELIPRGGTPLLDAMGKAMAHLSLLHNVLCMVITDGEENSSHEWTRDRIKARVEELQTKQNWTFLFLGANIDAFAEAASFGMAAAGVMNFRNDNKAAVGAMYAATASNTLRARGQRVNSGAGGQSVREAYAFTAEQRNAAMTGESDERTGSVSSSSDSSADKKTEG